MGWLLPRPIPVFPQIRESAAVKRDKNNNGGWRTLRDHAMVTTFTFTQAQQQQQQQQLVLIDTSEVC